MTHELVPIPSPHFSLPPAIGSGNLVDAFLGGRNPRTLKAYERDLEDFARFLGAPTAAVAVSALLAGTHGHANAIALAYRTHLAARELKSATIGRRLAALRSIVKLARTLGQVPWTLEVEAPKSEAYRDTTGPGKTGWRAMLKTANTDAETRDPKAVRNLALIRLLHDLALRRSEAIGLDVTDVDLAEGSVAVLGKGKTDTAKLTMSRQARLAVGDWLAVRGSEPGPLFVRLDRASKSADRLTGEAVRRLVADLAQRADVGKVVRPHGLRHQGITAALDATGGNVRDVQKFSRHAKLETLMIYDDRRVDVAGRISQMVGDED